MAKQFFTNGRRFTAIADNGTFIQVMNLQTVNQLTTGNNREVIADAKRLDRECTEDEFIEALQDHISNMYTVIHKHVVAGPHALHIIKGGDE